MPLDKPFEKSEKTVTFVGEDGTELNVVSNITKQGLAILKKQGYKKQSERNKEQDDLALAKGEKLIAGDQHPQDDAPPVITNRTGTSEVKKAPARPK